MSKLKNLTLTLILAIFALLSFSIPLTLNNKRVHADTSNSPIVLKAEKVNNTLTIEGGEPKKLSECTSKELYENLDVIRQNSTTILNGEVVSLNTTTGTQTANEAVLVTLMSSGEQNAIIKFLNLTLNVNGTSIFVETYSITGSNENRIYIQAFDFSTLKDRTGIVDFPYSTGYFEFTVNYSYTTNGENIITPQTPTTMNFYMVKSCDYDIAPSISSNHDYPALDKVEKTTTETANLYYYNYADENQPTLKYNPYRYNPSISFTYNETEAYITTELITNREDSKPVVDINNNIIDGAYIKLISDNEFVIPSQNIKINENLTPKEIKENVNDINNDTVLIPFDTLGKYNISYELIIQTNNNYSVVIQDADKKLEISSLKNASLEIFGFETLYKDYSKDKAYSKLYNKGYRSNFSYLFTESTSVEAIKNDITTKLATYDLSKIATTNQAPVKVNSYVTAIDLENAKYFTLNSNGSLADGNLGFSFSTSKRFEQEGFYAIIIPYNFSIKINNSGVADTNTYYSVQIFKIENKTPVVNFYSDANLTTEISKSNFTNTDVYCAWNSIEVNPFSTQPKFVFKRTTNNTTTILKETVDYTIQKNESANKQYVLFDQSKNGTYSVNVEYGINTTSVSKTFTIDTEAIDYNLYSVEKDENLYILSNKLEESTDTAINGYQTNSYFSLFVKDKTTQNTISIKYDYIALEDIENSNKFIYDETEDKLYIYNNKQLDDFYPNLNYINTKTNNLNSFDELSTSYNFANNNNAVISNAGLYYFTISDLAGNVENFFVFLDNSTPRVLSLNAVRAGIFDDGVEDQEVNTFLTNNNNLLTNKELGRNLVSNEYSLILGNGKAIIFNVTNDSLSLAKKYFNIAEDDTTFVAQQYNKFFNYDKVEYSVNEQTTTNHAIDKYNIISVLPQENIEVDEIYSATINYNVNDTITYEFNLNTDKNQILIYGYGESQFNNGYFRVSRNTATNSKEVYIRYIDNSLDENYRLESLILYYYPMIYSDGEFNFDTNAQEFNLLDMSSDCTFAQTDDYLSNSVLTGGYITSLINPTYLNGEFVTREGKYVITKTYVGHTTSPEVYPQISQTFYVDRHSPIEYFNGVLIGKDIEFTFDTNALTAENILYFINNNLLIETNKLPFNSNFNENVYKYNGNELENDAFKIYYEIFENEVSSANKVYSYNSDSNYTFKTTGTYIVRIYDNCGYIYNGNKNINSNYIDFRINLNDNKPYGSYYIENNQEIIKNPSSTNSNTLKFVFESSTSDYLYDIDLQNLILKQNGNTIFQTYASENLNTKYHFDLNGRKIYYYSSVGALMLTETEIASEKIPSNSKRYRYVLTFYTPEFNYQNFYVNNISKEAVYEFILSYKTYNNDLILNGNSYKTNTYKITVDHTSPFENVNKLIDNDAFLTDTEKQIMKDSVKNKDRTNAINFDNYAFVIKDAPAFFNSMDTDKIYIRKYDKYEDRTIADHQSLVVGDGEYNNLGATRYKFDINATNSLNQLIYAQKTYNSTLNSFFSNGYGYYEIIEIDEAGNFTIYSVLYSNDYNIQADYVYSTETTQKTGSNYNNTDSVYSYDVTINDVGFELTTITPKTTSKDYLNVILTINDNVETLRYFPINITNENIKYFVDLNDLVAYINNAIENDSTNNQFGSVYKMNITNRAGTTLNITNNTPNEELQLRIVDYQDRFVVTIPEQVGGTYITSFSVYPVIDGQKATSSLTVDSTDNQISATASSTYIFKNNNSAYEDKTISIYYLYWTDNFNRTQTKVKVIGIIDYKYFDFGTELPTEIVYSKEYGNETYSASKNVKLVYQRDLYNIEVFYQMGADKNSQNKLNIVPTSGEINLLTELNAILGGNNDLSQIRFIVRLTDLTTLAEQTPTSYQLSYVYYPLIPTLEFTDSSGNALAIHPIDKSEFIINTSKNVSLSYINSTYFPITISGTRVYEDENKILHTEKINNILNEHIFSQLGRYTLTVVNSLGKTQVYEFNIKSVSNRTFAVYTDEQNITNFEVESSKTTKTFQLNNQDVDFVMYYTIYNTTVEVNSDFNLTARKYAPGEITSIDNISNIEFWLIQKTEAVDSNKYIAIQKVDFNSDFLNIKADNVVDSKLDIHKVSTPETNLVSKEYLISNTLKITEGSEITLPLYNLYKGNKINITVYFNNDKIELNSNIYRIDEQNVDPLKHTQTLSLVNVPAGIYSIYFEDLAGNVQLFNGNAFLSIINLTEIMVSLNNKNVINYQIFNSTVNLKILEERQYATGSIVVSGEKNGANISRFTRNSNGDYVFSEYGFYKITIEANTIVNNAETKVEKTVYFTILNPNEAFKEFSFISLNGQVISKILRDGQDVTNEIKKFMAVGIDDRYPEAYFENSYLYNLNLASKIIFNHYVTDPETGEFVLDENGNKIVEFADEYLASGNYEIFVENQYSILQKETFSFKVWIRNSEILLKVNPSIPEGGSTTKQISLSYNPYLIYSQIGECGIYITDTATNISVKVVDINAESKNEVNNFAIPNEEKGTHTYIVQLKTDSGSTELSFIVTKKEPLTTTSIIVIIIVSIVVVGAIVIFIKLRTKIKVK